MHKEIHRCLDSMYLMAENIVRQVFEQMVFDIQDRMFEDKVFGEDSFRGGFLSPMQIIKSDISDYPNTLAQTMHNVKLAYMPNMTNIVFGHIGHITNMGVCQVSSNTPSLWGPPKAGNPRDTQTLYIEHICLMWMKECLDNMFGK